MGAGRLTGPAIDLLRLAPGPQMDEIVVRNAGWGPH
jgi:hypothetical protein